VLIKQLSYKDTDVVASRGESDLQNTVQAAFVVTETPNVELRTEYGGVRETLNNLPDSLDVLHKVETTGILDKTFSQIQDSRGINPQLEPRSVAAPSTIRYLLVL
jgi:hypothetical protein